VELRGIDPLGVMRIEVPGRCNVRGLPRKLGFLGVIISYQLVWEGGAQ